MDKYNKKLNNKMVEQTNKNKADDDIAGDFFGSGSESEEEKVPKEKTYLAGTKPSKYEIQQAQVADAIKAQWEVEQNTLKANLEEDDRHDWVLDTANPDNTTLKRIAAVDISYSSTDSQKAVTALIIFDFPSFTVLYEDFEKNETDYPYVPGFLAFKEVPSYTVLFDRLNEKRPDLWPELVMCDGNGILHQRGFGIASHIGVVFDIPTIGVGKTVFAVDGLTAKGVKALCDAELHNGGDKVELTGTSGKVWGAALRATDDSKNPLIISIGHRVSLETALEVTQACITNFRIPEPIRQADKRSRAIVKQVYDNEKGKKKGKK